MGDRQVVVVTLAIAEPCHETEPNRTFGIREDGPNGIRPHAAAPEQRFADERGIREPVGDVRVPGDEVLAEHAVRQGDVAAADAAAAAELVVRGGELPARPAQEAVAGREPVHAIARAEEHVDHGVDGRGVGRIHLRGQDRDRLAEEREREIQGVEQARLLEERRRGRRGPPSDSCPATGSGRWARPRRSCPAGTTRSSPRSCGSRCRAA